MWCNDSFDNHLKAVNTHKAAEGFAHKICKENESEQMKSSTYQR